jgi:uncharacterized OB-fold protein
MDILVGLLIVVAMVYVLSRPFRKRSSGEEAIYRRVAGLDGDEIERRVPCPHCGELLLPEARACPHCSKEIPSPHSK